MDRLLLSLCLIFLSLAAGHAAQHLLCIPRPRLESIRKRLQSFAVFCLIPCSAMLSLWGLPSPDSRLLALPFLGIASWIWGGLLSLRVARALSGCAAYRQFLLLRDLLQSGCGGGPGLRHVLWRKGHRHRGTVPDLRRNVLLRDLLSCGTPSRGRRRCVPSALLPA